MRGANRPFDRGTESAVHGWFGIGSSCTKVVPFSEGFADLAGDNRFLSCLTIFGCSPRTDRILAADEQTAQLAWDILRCLVSPLWLRARCFMWSEVQSYLPELEDAFSGHQI